VILIQDNRRTDGWQCLHHDPPNRVAGKPKSHFVGRTESDAGGEDQYERSTFSRAKFTRSLLKISNTTVVQKIVDLH